MKKFIQKLKPKHLWLVGMAFLSGLSESAYSGEMGSLGQTQLSSPWEFQLAPRYWYSSGRYKGDLYGFPTPTLVSRLTYSDLTGQAAEGFWQLNHRSGLFIKGYVGGGAIIRGHLNDEDFPPVVPSYSNTFHKQKNGNINYVSVDLGYQWVSELLWKLSTFIGYHYWNERLNVFGAYQLADSSPQIDESSMINGISNTATLSSLRIGVNAVFHFLDPFYLSSELNYIRSYLSSLDYHNIVPDIRGTLDEGQGNGFQIEAALNWSPTQALSMGVGYRLWTVQTEGFSHFEQTAQIPNAGPNPIHYNWYRYGLFLQAKYRFLDTLPQTTENKCTEPMFDWVGLYADLNLGYGTSPRTIYISSVQPNTFTQLLPQNLNVQDTGFFGGGQVGYQYQLDQLLLGFEADLDYASLGGANTVRTRIRGTINNFQFNTSANKNLGTLSTFRARVGKLADDNVLIYLTGGGALGKARLNFEQEMLSDDFNDGYRSDVAGIKNKLGWAAGTGVEFAVDSAMSLKAEYLYISLGKMSLNMAVNNYTNYTILSRFSYNLFRLGINYKFKK